jgi:hypothetical protein
LNNMRANQKDEMGEYEKYSREFSLQKWLLYEWWPVTKYIYSVTRIHALSRSRVMHVGQNCITYQAYIAENGVNFKISRLSHYGIDEIPSHFVRICTIPKVESFVSANKYNTTYEGFQGQKQTTQYTLSS